MFLLAGLIAMLVAPLALSAGGQTPRVQYRVSDERGGYELIWRGRRPLADDGTLIANSQGNDRPVAGPYLFNSIVRRNPCFLVSGDLPRLALGRVFVAPNYSPPLVKLGDLRLRCTVQDKSWWLDERGPIKARFYPWGTIHEVSLKPQAPLAFTITSTLVENCGMAVEVAVAATEGSVPDVGLELFFGGLELKNKELKVQPCYFLADPNDAQNDNVHLQDGQGLLSDPRIAGVVTVAADPVGEVVVTPSQPPGDTANRVVYRQRFKAKATVRKFHVLAWHADGKSSQSFTVAKFDQYVRQTREYFDRVLAPYEIRTPDPLLNAAFYSAIVNLDYLYQSPGWYEGIHQWNAFFVNNYQLSAALALGQMDRVKETLIFNADKPGGPGQGLNSDGNVNLDLGPNRFDEGILYYILQLHRYWQATGDRATLDHVWKATSENLEGLFKLRDPDGNLLLNWHQACNFFLYQADHLSLPGDAFSPTIMTAHCLEQMADLAAIRGDQAQAAKWRQRSAYMQREALRRFWSPTEGKFVGAIDPQGLAMQTNYYTDFVFPQLYSALPMEYAWVSLRTLDRTLWVGQDLMRVGNFLPQLFGNNNVMPVQMAEAAEAYCRAGRADEGSRLLHGVARGATVSTDSPGSFPERMSDTGYGQPDFTFGNPTGSYIRGVATGLFGVERTAPKRPMIWRPAIPESWPEASIKLGEISAAVRNESRRSRFEIKLNRPQALEFQLALNGRKIKSILDSGGHNIAYQLKAHPSGGMLSLMSPPAPAHKLTIEWADGRAEPRTTKKVKSGEQIAWTLPNGDMTVSDPQQALTNFRVEASLLTGRLAAAQGRRTVFLEDRGTSRMQALELDFGEPKRAAGPLKLKGVRRPLDLHGLFNGASINSQNFWRYGPIGIDLSKKLRSERGKAFLNLAGSDFVVQPSGNNMIVLEVGDLNQYTAALALSDKPKSVRMTVGERVLGLEFLACSEWKTRLTGMAVGAIELHYHDGSVQNEPLVYGGNLDCMTKPFATATRACDLGNMNSIYSFSLKTDPSRRLDQLDVRLNATDGALGILAINTVKEQ